MSGELFDQCHEEAQAPQQTAAARDVLAERARQVSDERWSVQQDDGYTAGQLADAAACYAERAHVSAEAQHINAKYPPSGWPWDKEWWKPTTPRRNLVKAAALLLAEIERLDRQAGSQ